MGRDKDRRRPWRRFRWRSFEVVMLVLGLLILATAFAAVSKNWFVP